ncbi:hypothetical protein BC832DRAFT_595143 [Gaertneriomyces semiglobifer]|nr:hypothetical protein BC832DRAFT_595143 [Gaertneriomyces semiglobifer]
MQFLGYWTSGRLAIDKYLDDWTTLNAEENVNTEEGLLLGWSRCRREFGEEYHYAWTNADDVRRRELEAAEMAFDSRKEFYRKNWVTEIKRVVAEAQETGARKRFKSAAVGVLAHPEIIEEAKNAILEATTKKTISRSNSPSPSSSSSYAALENNALLPDPLVTTGSMETNRLKKSFYRKFFPAKHCESVNVSKWVRDAQYHLYRQCWEGKQLNFKERHIGDILMLNHILWLATKYSPCFIAPVQIGTYTYPRHLDPRMYQRTRFLGEFPCLQRTSSTIPCC